MTRRLLRLCARSGVACCFAFATLSCSTLDSDRAPALPSRQGQPPDRHRVVQFAFGRKAVFGMCAEAACPRVTPKTPATDARQSVATPLREPSSTVALAIEAPILEVTVTFAFGSARLTPAAKASLAQAIQGARQSRSIVISGRTDSIGSTQANEALALARAEAVRDYLKGLAPDLTAAVSIDAKGLCCFVASNADEDGRAKNRRVDVVFNGLQGA